jgi:4a-hydroxytetrahydrobiopterin dehydratase
VDKLGADKVQELLREVEGWEVHDEKLHRTFQFKNFVIAMDFVNKLSDIAEGEGHHPDFCVHYNRVDVTLWTHAINGLTENDFIVAAKLDKIRV